MAESYTIDDLYQYQKRIQQIAEDVIAKIRQEVILAFPFGVQRVGDFNTSSGINASNMHGCPQAFFHERATAKKFSGDCETLSIDTNMVKKKLFVKNVRYLNYFCKNLG